MSETLPFLLVAPLSFGVALLLTPLVRALARRTDYLDHPDERKPHPEPTPLLGGVAVFGALVLGPILARAIGGTPIALPASGVLLGGVLSLVLGLVDDRRPMRPLGKLIGQIAVAVSLVAWGGAPHFVPGHPLFAAAAVVAVVALLNAVNFLDAMDGIVSALTPVTGLGFVALALLHGADVDLALAWGAVGAAAGFLVYNAPPARICLGDAGSHLLGFVLATLALVCVSVVISLELIHEAADSTGRTARIRSQHHARSSEIRIASEIRTDANQRQPLDVAGALREDP